MIDPWPDASAKLFAAPERVHPYMAGLLQRRVSNRPSVVLHIHVRASPRMAPTHGSSFMAAGGDSGMTTTENHPHEYPFQGFDESVEHVLGADMRLIYGFAAPILMVVGLIIILALNPATW